MAKDLEVCHFPKHDGEKWEDVVEDDREYVEWLVSGDGPDMRDELYHYLCDLLEE